MSEANKAITAQSGFSKDVIGFTVDTVKELGGVLGLLQKSEDGEISAEVKALLDERQAARASRDWAKSDELRDKLREMGITVKDTPQGQQIVRE